MARCGPLRSWWPRCSAALYITSALALAAEPAPAQLTLASPVDYSVIQRSEPRKGSIIIEGEWSLPRNFSGPGPDKLEGRLTPPPAGLAPRVAGPWSALPFDARVHGFRAVVPAAAGGWYRVEVRLRAAGTTLVSLEVAHVGIGEVYIIAGQSNAANYGETPQYPKSGYVSAWAGGRWTPAADPQPGATGAGGSFIPSFGDALVAALHVPVGVVCLAVGSTSVREWLPRGVEMSHPPTTGAHCFIQADGKIRSTGELYSSIVGAIRQFPQRGVRAVLWHQGESDWNQPAGHEIELAEYETDLKRIIAASREAAGWDVPWFVAQTSYHSPGDPGSPEFRAAQRAVTDGALTRLGPNTDELTGPMREKNGTGVHFSAAGLQRHGELWAAVIAEWLNPTR